MQPDSNALSGYFWIVEMIIGVAVLVLINYLFKKLVKHVKHRSLSTQESWREQLDHIFYLPVHILLWVLGGILIIEVWGRHFDFSFFGGYLSSFRTTAIVGCLSWALLRWNKVIQRFALHSKHKYKYVDASFVQVVGRIASIVVVLIAGLIVLQVWGLNIGPLIAFGGIGAAVVGFAAKDVISNFFGGLMLYITRPFVDGDYIILDSLHLEGHVEEIGWYLTSVRDKQKRAVYLPNAIFSNALVVNGSRMSHRRIEEKIAVSYSDFSKVSKLVEAIRQVVISHPEIDTHQPVLISLARLEKYFLEIDIDVYTLATRQEHYVAVKQEILSLIYQVLLAENVELPNPILEIRQARDGYIPNLQR